VTPSVSSEQTHAGTSVQVQWSKVCAQHCLTRPKCHLPPKQIPRAPAQWLSTQAPPGGTGLSFPGRVRGAALGDRTLAPRLAASAAWGCDLAEEPGSPGHLGLSDAFSFQMPAVVLQGTPGILREPSELLAHWALI
jgi:hypothetical protein